jgi:hypothetical protein
MLLVFTRRAGNVTILGEITYRKPLPAFLPKQITFSVCSLLILARGVKFAEFRAVRLTTDDPFKLVTKLDSYSEKGALYGKELTAIIRRNEFQQYD